MNLISLSQVMRATPWLPLVATILVGCGKTDKADSAAEEPDGRKAAPAPGRIESRPLPERTWRDQGEALFEALEPAHTGIDFGPRWDDPARFLKELLFVNPSGGICAGDYDADGLPDLYVTSPSGGNRLYRNLGDFKFEDVTESAGVADPEFWGTGACFVDIDNDGDLDLYACGYTRSNKLYLNDGSGKFTDRAREIGLDYNGGSMMMSFADIDNDGDLDGYLATTAIAPPPGTKFRVNFVARESDGVEIPVVIPELREYWEILIKPGEKGQRVEAGQDDHLFRNEGGKFVDVSKAAGIAGAYFTLSATWWDYDRDGDADLYVSNDYTGPDMLYRNRGDGTFENVIGEVLPHTPWFSMGSDVGDLNGDGLLDFFASDMAATSHYREKVMMGNMDDMGWFLEWAEPRQYMRNVLYLNSGAARFQEAAHLAGLASSDWSWSPRIEDFDQDGRADLFITNGIMRDSMNSDVSAFAESQFRPGSPEYIKFWVEQPLHKEDNLAFRNLGDLKFQSIGALWGLQHHGVSFGAVSADFDGDGDPDLAVSNIDKPVSLYRNRGTEHHRIAVKLVGKASNQDGLGATIRLLTSAGMQSRAITSARGWLSASETTALFGLGDETAVEQLEILWPGGTRQVFTDLEADQFYTIYEPVGQPAPEIEPAVLALYEKSSHLASAVHEEAPFDDFARQPLLPYKLSQLGPGTAWGDLDGDGDDDFFLGGARGHPGQIFLNTGGGKFAPFEANALAAHADSEDAGALFFDADADGDLDLYVASGGVEDDAGHLNYRDRLYLNEGKGILSDATKDVLPEARLSSGPVAAADFDRDGDLDLFVGGRTIPGQYPLAPASRLLVNSGGKFTLATAEQLPGVQQLGMVTAAIWSDANGDGWPDLLLAVEWGAVRYFENDGGKLVDKTRVARLADRLGWWNGITAGDFDADGDIDYLVTNFGLNSKYEASSETPEFIFYGDLDGSGQAHIVEAKFEDGKFLPRRGFSCSRNAMPFLKGKIKTFHNFASAGLAELYTENKLASALRLEANTLESGVLINDGGAVFSWRPLPRIVQIAPAFGVVLEDIDGDGDLDAVLAQNSFSPQRETGRMDGGLGQVLLNDGAGHFSALTPKTSGVEIPGDAKSLSVADLDADGRPDLIFGMNNGATITYLGRGGKIPLAVRLESKAGNPTAVGARVTIADQIREQHAGGGYASQSTATLYFAQPGEATKATVRWPDGSNSEHPIDAGARQVTFTQP